MSERTYDTNKTTPYPADIAPLPNSVRAKNEFKPGSIFPFKSLRSLPSLPVVLTNIALQSASLVAAVAGLFVTTAVFLPLGVIKSFGSTIGGLFGGAKKSSVELRDNRRKVVVINGASSGIGAAMVTAYAQPNTHLVLIARSMERLNAMASAAQEAGATTSVHSLEYFERENVEEMRTLLKKVDREYNGIDIAINLIGVTGHRNDVVGRKQEASDEGVAPEIRDVVMSMETGEVWGPTVAERMLEVNVRASQSFILTAWELMKARRSLPDASRTSYHPKIIIFASSAAFFSPANFSLYAASKSYLYSLGQSLQVLSAPYGIQILTVCPGFIESGMTHTMLQEGATIPVAMLGDPGKLAKRVRRAEERNDLVLVYPLTQVLPLFGAKALNPLLEIFGMWFGAAQGAAAWVIS